MEYPTVKDWNHFEELRIKNSGIVFYFSNDDCNVCKVLKPKVYEMLQEKFPEMKFYYVDTKSTPDVAAQNRVFTIPTILVFFEGSEIIRKSRYIGINELADEIARPYQILFSEV